MTPQFRTFVMIFAAGLLPMGVFSANSAAARPSESTVNVTPSADRELGKPLFERNCAVCHGIDGSGGRGPSLKRAHLAHATDDAALRAVIENGIPPEMPDGSFLTDEDQAAIASYVRSLGKIPPQNIPGNVAHGATIYANSGCPACHILAGKGSGYGPELTDLPDRRSVEYVREAIRKPATKLPPDFLMVRVTTAQGGIIQGIRLNEDSFTIQLKDATGQLHSFRRTEVRELLRLKSQTPMPSFDGVLTSTDLNDLVAYLVSPREAP